MLLAGCAAPSARRAPVPAAPVVHQVKPKLLRAGALHASGSKTVRVESRVATASVPIAESSSAPVSVARVGDSIVIVWLAPAPRWAVLASRDLSVWELLATGTTAGTNKALVVIDVGAGKADGAKFYKLLPRPLGSLGAE